MPTDEELRALLPVIQERLPTLGASATSSGSCGSTDVTSIRRSLVPEALGPRDDAATAWRPRATTIDAVGRRVVRGRRARAAAAGARRSTRLEGRRPVHGHPRGGHRPDRDAAAVRHARRARPRAGPRPHRPRHCECSPAMTRDDVPGLARSLHRGLGAVRRRTRSATCSPTTPDTATTRPMKGSSGGTRSSEHGLSRPATRAAATSQAPGMRTTSRSSSTAIAPSRSGYSRYFDGYDAVDGPEHVRQRLPARIRRRRSLPVVHGILRRAARGSPLGGRAALRRSGSHRRSASPSLVVNRSRAGRA